MLTIKNFVAIVCGLSAMALVVAFALEYLGGYLPCEMCWWQRYVYMAIVGVGFIGWLTKRLTLAAVVIAGLLVIQVGISGFHAGVELGVFALPEGCIAGTQATSVEDLRALLLNAAPTCDQVSLSFAGLSLTIWNALFAAVLCALTIAVLVRDWVKR